MPEIELNGRKIKYELVLRNVRYIRMQFLPEGILRVISPIRNVEPFLRAKEAWITSRFMLFEEAMSKEGFPYLGEFRNIEVENLHTFEKRLRKELKEILEPSIREKREKIGAAPEKIFIRKQRTRWGSCSSRGNLSFNLALIALPVELIDYVVTHEVAHLLEPNHGKGFWGIVSKFHPDYREKRARLKEWWIMVNGNRIWSKILRYP